MASEYSHFDLDFRDGKVGEGLVEMCIRTVEVKLDRQFIHTGNIFIETKCRCSGEWCASGLAVTRAGHYGIVIGHPECRAVLFFPTSVVGEAYKNGHPIECGKEPNPTRGRLIKINNLLRALKHLGGSNENPEPQLEATLFSSPP